MDREQPAASRGTEDTSKGKKDTNGNNQLREKPCVFHIILLENIECSVELQLFQSMKNDVKSAKSLVFEQAIQLIDVGDRSAPKQIALKFGYKSNTPKVAHLGGILLFCELDYPLHPMIIVIH